MRIRLVTYRDEVKPDTSMMHCTSHNEKSTVCPTTAMYYENIVKNYFEVIFQSFYWFVGWEECPQFVHCFECW